MECPSCYETYDEQKRIPRNLLCGHTFCEACLEQIYLIKKKLKCPVCTAEMDPSIKPRNLSKNFVALEIASKHHEVQKKLLFCEEHKEPLRFFCENCQVNICPSCILDHNGHIFMKQDHSGIFFLHNFFLFINIVSLLTKRAKELKIKSAEKVEDLKLLKTSDAECIENMKQARDQELKRIDIEFDMLISHLIARKTLLKKNCQEDCQIEIATLDSEMAKIEEIVVGMNKSIEDIDKYTAKLGKY